MYHQPSKRKMLMRRIVSYAVMTIAVVTLVTVLVFVMLGYRYNGNDGKVEQGGLVQFDTQPNGANVTIDNQPFGTRTPTRTTLTSGSHTITMNRSGYDSWQKTVDVTPGSVLWLSYARLIPTKLTPESTADFTTVTSSAVSPDDRWMAVKEKADTPEIKLADISSDKVINSTLTLPSESYTHPAQGKTQSFTIMDWDAGSRYLMVRHSYGGDRLEWLVVDTRDITSTKNVTKLLDIQATKMVFSGNDSQVLYAQIGTDVRKIDLGAATLSRPLVQNVAEFSIFDQRTIAYSTTLDPDTKTRTVGYYEDGDQNANVIRSFTDDGKKPLHLALGRYFGTMYEAIAYGDKITIYSGDLPTTAQEAEKLKEVASMDFAGGTQYLANRTAGRFVIAQRGNKFKVYDLELKKETTTTQKGPAAGAKKLRWLDGYTAYGDQDGMLRLYEFDGANQHDIMKVAPGFEITLSQNEKYLYGISKDASGYHLQRVQMILS